MLNKGFKIVTKNVSNAWICYVKKSGKSVEVACIIAARRAQLS